MTTRERIVLVVEDEAGYARMLVEWLKPHVVEVASTVEQARDRLSRRSYCAWIFDVRLPDGDGVALLRWARELDRGCPALLVSGESPSFYVNAAHELHAEALTKPCEPERFRDVAARASASSALVVAARQEALRAELSPRETEAIELFAQGVPAGVLAEELGVARSTLKTLVNRALRKMGAENLGDVLMALLRSLHGRETGEATPPPAFPQPGMVSS